MLLRIVDDRGRTICLPRPPQRIVSLVPSDTYTVARLGAVERIVGRTRYCVEPADALARVPEVGGTKDPSVEQILDLAPELVLMNQEENTREVAVALEDRRVPVFVSFPKRFAAGFAQVGRIARALGELSAGARDTVREAYASLRDAESTIPSELVPAFVPIWMDPLMTIHKDTFISDVLRYLGLANVFAERERRFPLRADLGVGPALPAERTAGRDTRYPRVTLDEVRSAAPEIVLLPDEPHPFTEADADVFRGLDLPRGRLAENADGVVFCSGKHLTWPGLMSLEGLAVLRASLAPRLRSGLFVAR